MPKVICPLCLGRAVLLFHCDKKRDYLRCGDCHLVFVPPSQHLSLSEEKALYDLHENSLDDPGYRKFLSRLAEPLQSRLKPGAKGLDYGCGPGPLLAHLLTQQGYRVELYDPFYADSPCVLQDRYDFISCTEVVEHFRQPHEEFRRLFGLLTPGGYLGLMTKLVINADAFSRWHYKNDSTHVCFYSRETLDWLAALYRSDIDIIGRDVVIFRTQDRTS
ncbi:MAG: class I SAM-dependent methyltransferase [Methylomonas sp.]|nr:class I SAM-dependent methyltransferase [Methylomonas sp.]